MSSGCAAQGNRAEPALMRDQVRPLAARGVQLLEKVLTRRHVARAARFVLNQARRDVRNGIATNGEMLVQRALLAAVPGQMCVIDVGAHYGEWSCSLLSQSGGRDVRVHAFEPSSYTFERLRQALGAVDGVTLNRSAVSDSPGRLALQIVHAGAGSNSLVPFTAGEYRPNGETEEVPVTTVEAYCAAEGLRRVHLLKVDAEGHDLAVLRGASAMLAENRVDCVQFEYNRRWIDSRAFLLDAFDLLNPLGYTVGKVTPAGIEFYDRWHSELETFTEGNYVGILPALVDAIPTVPWWGP